MYVLGQALKVFVKIILIGVVMLIYFHKFK